MKNLRHTFCRELNFKYKPWLSLWWHHCDISYKHYRWRHCQWKYPARNSVLLFILWSKLVSTIAIHTEINPMHGD